jgi:hypothetical protein
VTRSPLDERVTKPAKSAIVTPVVIALLVAAVGGGLWMRRGGTPELKPTNPEVTYTTGTLPAGDTTFSLGDLLIERPGADVQVISVKPLTSPNVEYLGAFTTWPRDIGAEVWTGGPGFPGPNQKHLHDLSEVVPAAEFLAGPNAMSVTVGFRITSGDIGVVNGLLLTYKVGGKTKHRIAREAIIACVQPNPCDPTGDQDRSDWEESALRQFGLLPKD